MPLSFPIGVGRAIMWHRRNVVIPGPFAPDDLSNLALWYDAQAISASDGAAISQWDDLSGNGRNATQADSAKRPLYDVDGLNGHPCVVFDATNDALATASTQLTGGAKLTIYVVAQVASGSDRVLLEYSSRYNLNTGAFLVYRTSSNVLGVATWQTTETVWRTTATLTTTPKIITARFDRTPINHTVIGMLDGAVGGDEFTTGNSGGGNFGTYPLFIGSRDNGASLPLSGRIGEILIYADAHSPAERLQVEEYLSDRWGITSTAPGGFVVFEGDSLTNGAPVEEDAYPHHLMAALTGNHDFVNVSVAGQTLAQMHSDISQVTGYYDPANSDNVVVLWGGTNDMVSVGGNQTAATTLARFYNYADALRASGFSVVGLTMLPRSDAVAPADFEAKRTTFNTDVRANWASHFDALADVAADTRIGDAGDELDTTYYDVTEVHLNATGYQIVADIVETALATIGIT